MIEALKIKFCPLCGSAAAWTKFTTHTFGYGYPEAVMLTVPMFPVGRCEDCEFEWYDGEAGALKDATVQKYQRVLATTTPSPDAGKE